MNKFVVIFIFLFCVSCNISAQSEEYEQVNSTLMEFGLGYSKSVINSTSHFDAFFNIGYQKPIREKYFIGFLFSPQYRLRNSHDFILSSKMRFGKLVSSHSNISFGLGYSLYSRQHDSFPGLALDFNYDKTNDYGFHLKYEELNSVARAQERNIVVGLHLTSGKAAKIGLPVIGGVAGVLGILYAIISQSK